jgi:uncharacterized protein
MQNSPKELITQNHVFPGPYRFKVIGDNTPAFVSAVTEVAKVETGSAWSVMQQRTSAAGNHLAITATVDVQDADQVLKIYDALRAVPAAKMVL